MNNIVNDVLLVYVDCTEGLNLTVPKKTQQSIKLTECCNQAYHASRDTYRFSKIDFVHYWSSNKMFF